MCSPLQNTATDFALNEWANAHSSLLIEEAKLVDLCRRLTVFEIGPDELTSQRERVASLRELSEVLYARVMTWLQGPT
ncbi:hypothetical protein GCM10028796_13710 [Ramlibacter monticola]|uniref:Uncharacterized protein n=1 Tax=Ramlibacter monticola TaxID=1926872 RepID=A0A936YX15_9BURK|nr:hypothetical protein [Ramlibacter monticola]MBL0390207.1 hypothetical protein [Ramlibacter monticola]